MHLQPALHIRVGGHQGRDLIDVADDGLGPVVARRGLGAEDEGLGRGEGGGVFLDAVVQVHQMEGVEQLPLVFVKPLDLDVEEGLRVQPDPFLLFDEGRQLPLLDLLDGYEPLQHLPVVGVPLQLLQGLQLPQPAV